MPSDVPRIFDSRFYDEKYFADKEGKSFCRSSGVVDHWGYRNPEGEWLGCKPIVEAFKSIFNPGNMLDIGCGRGTFVAYARDTGIQAEGFDFSGWAVNNLYPRCKKEWIRMHDATKPWPYKDRQFDLVISLDFFEHMYIDDVPAVINEMYRVAGKWIFLQIATIDERHDHDHLRDGYVIHKEEEVPIEFEANAISGHVLIKRKQFWYDALKRDEWRIREDLVKQFCGIVPTEIISNWIANTLIVMERV